MFPKYATQPKTTLYLSYFKGADEKQPERLVQLWLLFKSGLGVPDPEHLHMTAFFQTQPAGLFPTTGHSVSKGCDLGAK